ncbi:MAG: hypothetical protein M1358_11180 [Chloroflexi bacterium]|nr:hypothetical protein [Chloroflexota bacterium]
MGELARERHSNWANAAAWVGVLVPVILALALTALLYGVSVSYGFMYDDPFDLPRSSDRSYLDIFTSAGQSSYYRPLILALWKTLYGLLGGNNAPVLHALVLIAHATNGYLVYLLGKRLGGWTTGLMASGIFITFPFSYQAVAYVNTFFHPLVTTFVLIAVLFYYEWRVNGSRLYLTFALVSTVLALLTHEYGVSLGPLIVALEALLLLGKRARARPLAPLLFLGIAVGFFCIWLVIPRDSYHWQFDWESILQNSEFFFQGLVYPAIIRLDGWPDPSSTPNDILLAIFGLPTLALLVLLGAYSRRLRILGYAFVWFAAAVTPALLSLPYSYVISGQRLLYLASVGISLAWGSVLAAPLGTRDARARWVGGFIGGIVAVIILIQGGGFALGRQVLFKQGAGVMRRFYSSATDADRPGRIYVNFPSWLAFKRNEFLFGHTGVTMVPDYIGLGRVLYIHNGEQPGIESAYYGPVAQQWVHWAGPHGAEKSPSEIQGIVRNGGAVYVTTFLADGLDLEYVGNVTRDCSTCSGLPYTADLGGWMRMLSAKVELEKGAAKVTLRWLSLVKPAKDLTVFVHVYDQNTKTVAQRDGYAVGRALPLNAWEPGDLIEDVRYIPLPADLRPGSYRVVVGVYDRENVQRIPATNSSGKRLQDDGVHVGDLAYTP